jgi:hypothetical protein
MDSQRNDSVRLVKIYLAVSGALAVLGSASAGGGVNHYLEPALAMTLLVPLGLVRLQAAWREPTLAGFAVVIMLAFLLPSLDVQRWNAMHSRPEDLRRLVPLVRNQQVFTDIPYLAARTSAPHLVDLASLINTQRVGGWAAWSSAKLAQAIKEKQYELIVLSRPAEIAYLPAGRYPRAPRLDSAIQREIIQNYRRCVELNFCYGLEFDTCYVYEPLSHGSSRPGTNCADIARDVAHRE